MPLYEVWRHIWMQVLTERPLLFLCGDLKKAPCSRVYQRDLKSEAAAGSMAAET